MKETLKVISFAIITFSLLWISVTREPSGNVVHAQSAASLVEIDIVQGPWAANCQTHTGVTTYCYGTDAEAISVAGAKYTQFQGVAGPQGPTGQTGATGPQGPAGTSTAGVASLNGHTGALTMSLGASPITITP